MYYHRDCWRCWNMLFELFVQSSCDWVCEILGFGHLRTPIFSFCFFFCLLFFGLLAYWILLDQVELMIFATGHIYRETETTWFFKISGVANKKILVVNKFKDEEEKRNDQKKIHNNKWSSYYEKLKLTTNAHTTFDIQYL